MEWKAEIFEFILTDGTILVWLNYSLQQGLTLKFLSPRRPIIGLCLLPLFVCCLGRAQSDEPSEKQGAWITVPAVSISPETGFGFGAGSLKLFKLIPEDTVSRTSQVRMLALYTTEKQFIFNTRYQLFTRNEGLFLTGRWEFLKFPEFYYGIGNETPESNEELVEYNSIGIESRVLKQVIPGFFPGIEFRYYSRFNYKLIDGGLLERTQVAGYNGSRLAGVGPLFVIDKRDNIANPYAGFYFLMSAFFHGSFLGGEFTYTSYRLDFRKYFKLFEDREDILAIQFLGNFVTGEAPFHNLSILGGSALMRGYYRGRFRDRHFMGSQVEYRMPIWWRIGAVAFLGVGNVASDLEGFKPSQFKHSVGGGLRFTVDQAERLNLRFDYGFGQDTRGFYLNVTEAF